MKALMPILILTITSPAVAESRAHDVSVWVAYADTLRKPGFVPNPWTTGVKFIGTREPWDAGAIAIVNKTSKLIVVDEVRVDIGPVHGINPWKQSTPVAIPAAGTLVLTQTERENFDTSDIPTISCTPDGYKPVIRVRLAHEGNEGHDEMTFVDSQQILNSGGVDQAACSGKNEGHAWVEISK